LKYFKPRANDYPNQIECTLDFGHSVCVAFNRRGTLLASGLADGRIAIWDFQTQCLAKLLRQHSQAVTSLMWSRNGRKLLSSCSGGEVCMWRVLEGTLDYRFVEAQKKPIVNASLNTRKTYICCATPVDAQPYLITVLDNKRLVLKRLQLVVRHKQKNAKFKPETNVLGVFSSNGKTVICGSSKGRVTELQFPELKILKTRKIGKSLIKSIKVSRCGKFLLVNSSDRTIRVMQADSFNVVHEFTDTIERAQWSVCSFSGNSEFVFAAPAGRRSQVMHVWSRHFGTLLCSMDQPGEPVKYVDYHPILPVLVTVSRDGKIHIWGPKDIKQNWTAFGHGFVELTENTWYVPEGSEPEKVRLARKLSTIKTDESVPVNIVAKDPICIFSEDESDEVPETDSLRTEMIHLPAIPIPDENLNPELFSKHIHRLHPTICSSRHHNSATITYILSFGDSKKKRKISDQGLPANHPMKKRKPDKSAQQKLQRKI